MRDRPSSRHERATMFRMHSTFFALVPIDILHSVFGFPTECTHNNVIRSCTLSFSCWMQGGRHAEGCGENKWLFSCCISDNELDYNAAVSFNNPVKSTYFENDLPTRFSTMSKIKAPSMPTPPFKQNMLRRRMDDEGTVMQIAISKLVSISRVSWDVNLSDRHAEIGRHIICTNKNAIVKLEQCLDVRANSQENFNYSLFLAKFCYYPTNHKPAYTLSISESIGMWNSTNGSKHHSKANHWRSRCSIRCPAMASAHSHSRIPMRRNPG